MEVGPAGKARGASGRQVLGRFAAAILHTPKYAVLAAGLARDGRLSPAQRTAAVAAFGYAVLPFDLLPGIIPVVGQMDDLVVMIGGLRAVIRGASQEVRTEHLTGAGLTLEVMDADLRAVSGTAWWLGRKGARFVGRTVGTAERLLRKAKRGFGTEPPAESHGIAPADNTGRLRT